MKESKHEERSLIRYLCVTGVRVQVHTPMYVCMVQQDHDPTRVLRRQ